MTEPLKPSEATEQADSIRIVLADDHAIVREGLKALIDGQHDMRVVGEVGDGQAAIDAARALEPDVLIMDLSMPVMRGEDATARLHVECPDVKILALTVHEERDYLLQLLQAGAAGYVLKRTPPSELLKAIRTVAVGDVYLDPLVVGNVVKGFLEASRSPSVVFPVALSERERDVLIRIASGYSNKEIAAALGLSVKTVETYKSRTADKLGLRTRADMVRYAADRGWLGSRQS